MTVTFFRDCVVRTADPETDYTIKRINATDSADGVIIDVAGDYQSQIVADAPTFYWKLDNDYVDSMGNATTGTAVSGVFGTAKYGSASATLDGTSGYINIPSHASMSFGTTQDFSIEMWIKKNAASLDKCLIDMRSSTSLGWSVRHSTADKIYLYIDGTAYTASTASIPEDGNYHHIVVVADRDANITYYIDNVAEVIATAPNANSDATSQLTIGGRSYAQPGIVFDGSIDEVAIYRKLLTAAEVAKHYTNGTRTKVHLTNSGTGIVDLEIDGRLLTPMGEISYSDLSTGTTIAIAAQSDGTTNLVVANPTTTFTDDMYFDNGGSDNGRLRYIGTYTKTFHIACTLTIAPAAANDVFVLAVAKNGTMVLPSRVFHKFITAGAIQSTALHAMVSLATNEYLELVVGNTTDADDLVLHGLNIVAVGM